MADFSKATPGSPLRTPLPKVGIRPVIDGRYGGVRESLEDATMQMAVRAGELIQSRVRHWCGVVPEIVIADTCIGGLAESADCEAKFQREGVGVSLTVTPCWCYGGETIDTDPTRPKAIWGFNGTQRPGAVYLAAALAAHTQSGIPAFSIYGRDVQDLGDEEIPEDVAEKIIRFVRAGLAVATMKGTTYLSLGGTSMGIAGSRVDSSFFERWLGMKVQPIDMVEVLGRTAKGMFDQDEYLRAKAWVAEHCPEGFDANPEEQQRTREEKDQDWDESIKMCLVVRDLMIGNPVLDSMGFKEQARGHNALAGGFQGQRQWTDHFPNGDFMEAILTSSFDWNGIRAPFAFATENDSLNAVSMLFGQLMTGSAQLFADVRTFWSPESVERVTGWKPDGVAQDGFIHLINSGPAALDWTGEADVKPWWELDSADAEACLEATTWHSSDLGYFPAGGWSTRFKTKGEIPCTMFRLNLVGGLGPVLQITEGWTVELPAEVHEILDQRTNPTWPTTWFVPRLTGDLPFDSAYSVMNSWGANHAAVAPGHVGADLVTLASALRIPVDMHNLPADQLFRPSAWTRFGAMEPQGADFRACQHFGPLFG